MEIADVLESLVSDMRTAKKANKEIKDLSVQLAQVMEAKIEQLQANDDFSEDQVETIVMASIHNIAANLRPLLDGEGCPICDRKRELYYIEKMLSKLQDTQHKVVVNLVKAYEEEEHAADKHDSEEPDVEAVQAAGNGQVH